MRTKAERRILQRNALRPTIRKGLSDTKSHKSSGLTIVTKNKKLYKKSTIDHQDFYVELKSDIKEI